LEADLAEAPGAHEDAAGGRLRAFVSEVERSLQYYRRAYKEAPQPRRLFLAGDHPAIVPAVSWLSDSQGIPVQQVHPLAGCAQGAGLHAEGDAFVAAVGAALRRIDRVGVDLQIARELQEAARLGAEAAARFRRTALMAATSLAAVAILATSLLTLRLRQARAVRDNAAATAQAARESREAFAMRRQAIDSDLRRLRRRRIPMSLLLRRLQRAVPGGMALTALDLKEDGTIALRGAARDDARVRDLMRRLTLDPRFREPELETLDAATEQHSILFVVRTGLLGYGLQASARP
jgi:Tfp pilus assembly protein PilN